MERLSLGRDEWENLARAGALTCFCERRQALWRVRSALRNKSRGEQMRLDFQAENASTRDAQLHDVPPLACLRPAERLAWDFQTQGLTTGPHPIALHRADLTKLGTSTIEELGNEKSGARVLVAGTVISRLCPPTAKGMCFLILEDETGRVPTAVTLPLYEKLSQVLRAPALLIEGQLEDGETERSGLASGNRYRSVLVGRMWALDRVCGSFAGGAAGHPGENPRAGVSAP